VGGPERSGPMNEKPEEKNSGGAPATHGKQTFPREGTGRLTKTTEIAEKKNLGQANIRKR